MDGSKLNVTNAEDYDEVRNYVGQFQRTIIGFDMYIKALTFGSESAAFKESSGGLTLSQWKRAGLQGKLVVHQAPSEIRQSAAAVDTSYARFTENGTKSITSHKKALRLELTGRTDEAEVARLEVETYRRNAENYEVLTRQGLDKISAEVDLLVAGLRSKIETTEHVILAILGGLSFISLAFLIILTRTFFTKAIVDPIDKLTQGAQAIGRGALETRIDLDTSDELQILADAFNEMTEHLSQSTRELQQQRDHLEDRVAERTQKLARSEKVMHEMALFAQLNPAPVLRFDIEGRVIMANPAALEILRTKQVIGQRLSECLPGTGDLHWAACIRKGKIFSYTAAIGNRHFQFVFQGVPDSGFGNVYGSDVTEHQAAEEALAKQAAELARSNQQLAASETALGQSNQTLQALIRAAPLPMVSMGDDLTIRMWNPAAERLFGWSEAEVIGRSFPVPKENYIESTENIKRALQGEVYDGMEIRRHRKDGTPIDVAVYCSPLIDAAGEISGIVSVCVDLAERKQAEEALAKQAQELASSNEELARSEKAMQEMALFAQLNPAPVLRFDMEGRVVMANPAATEILQGGIVKGEPLSALLPGTEELDWAACVRNAEIFSHTTPIGNRHFQFVFRGVPDSGFGNVYGSDITELQKVKEALAEQAQELTRSNEELAQFAYVASHDLQEPLRMVTSYTQLLARRYQNQLDGDANEFIDYAVDGATRMQGLINALLDYSRVGSQGKEFEPTDCEVMFQAVAANLKVAIEEIGAVVTHGPLPVVVADRSQLSRLFQNLIGNAIKYRGERTPKVHVSAQCKDGEVLFCVRDNGIGIAPEHLERVFVVFQRLHTREEYSGTGIGLAVCRKIVERHGGRIWVESKVDEGSSFYFTILGPSGTELLDEVGAGTGSTVTA